MNDQFAEFLEFWDEHGKTLAWPLRETRLQLVQQDDGFCVQLTRQRKRSQTLFRSEGLVPAQSFFYSVHATITNARRDGRQIIDLRRLQRAYSLK